MVVQTDVLHSFLIYLFQANAFIMLIDQIRQYSPSDRDSFRSVLAPVSIPIIKLVHSDPNTRTQLHEQPICNGKSVLMKVCCLFNLSLHKPRDFLD